jgi:hypothetical protein
MIVFYFPLFRSGTYHDSKARVPLNVQIPHRGQSSKVVLLVQQKNHISEYNEVSGKDGPALADDWFMHF